MLYVTSLDGSQQELLTKTRDFDMEHGTDGTLQVSFVSVPDEFNAGHNVLLPESVVTVADYDFRVKIYNDVAYHKSVTAISTFFDLDDHRQDTLLTGMQSIEQHATFAMKATGWTFSIDESLSGERRAINNFGKDNVVALVGLIKKYYACEVDIQPNNHVHFVKEMGPDLDYQYRHGLNVKALNQHIETSNLKTQIVGYGAFDENGNQLVITYTSPNHVHWDIRRADDVVDERFNNRETFTEYLKAQLTDEPEISIELDVVELVKRELGERIWLVYEPLNIKMHTRILTQHIGMRDGVLYTKSVVIGNSKRKSQADQIAEQVNEMYETQRLIEDNKQLAEEQLTETKEAIEETIDNEVREINYKFQETETKIMDQYTTVTSEYSASISANARQIRTEMSEHVTTINTAINAQYSRITEEYNSSITQTAREIRTDVTASITSVNANIQNVQNYASSISQTAQQIQSQVSSQQTIIDSQGTRISNAESSITQTANQIQSQINSQQTIIDGQGTRISSAESSITQQSNQIAQKVSQTDYNGATIATLINQTAYDVSISASKINLNGAVLVNGTISGATTISVTTDINLGRILRFSDQTAISSDGGSLTFGAWNDVNYQGSTHRFYGTVDLSTANNVIGLPAPTNVDAVSVNGFAMSTSVSGGKRYITFRQFGSYLGQIELAA